MFTNKTSPAGLSVSGWGSVGKLIKGNNYEVTRKLRIQPICARNVRAEVFQQQP